MREDSCSGVGARRDRELEPSGPEGGAGSLWRKSSSICSAHSASAPEVETKEDDGRSGPQGPKGKFTIWYSLG